MVVETPIPPLLEWLPGAALVWLVALVSLAALATLFALLVGIVRHGPRQAAANFGSLAAETWRDWRATSLRRIWALALLAIRESIRNRIVVALAVFAAILMFAGWFQTSGDTPARLFLDSIFQWSALLVSLVALLVAVFSLPGDIKNHTIYTVVTKPVRPQEIVLGRILGFGMVSAALLAVMLAAGYVFVGRMVDHEHAVDPESLVDLELPTAGGSFDENTLVETGRLQTASGHQHTFSLTASGFGVAENARGHWHVVAKDVTPRVRGARVDSGDSTRVVVRFTEPMDIAAASDSTKYAVTSDGRRITVESAAISADNRTVALKLNSPAQAGSTRVAVGSLTSRIGRTLAESEPVVVTDRESPPDASAYSVGPPEDVFRAQVPVYGDLRFTGRNGEESPRGISVGNPWRYRSYVPGASQASAIWRFFDVTPEAFGDFLRLEMTVAVFRTSKGNVEKTTRGTIILRNPAAPHIATKAREFASGDGPIAPVVFTRKLTGRDSAGRAVELDLYDDLAPDGQLEVVVQCSEEGQLFGMAQADAYLLAREASHAWNYVKAGLSLLFPVLIVVAIAVSASTALSSPVALLATLTYLICGLVKGFVVEIAYNQIYGGGPFENAYRLQQRMNLMEKLPSGWDIVMIQTADRVSRFVLQGVLYVLPDLTGFWRVNYLTDGFFIPGSHVVMLGLTAIAFFVPLVVAGYFFLKTREVAA